MSNAEVQQPASPDPGLPPVAPPSGRFILQLFLVPGLIVGLVVLILLGFQRIFGEPHSPEAILKKLDDPNVEIRWRGAQDLAQVLQRDPELASNTNFALELAVRLRKALEDNLASEKAYQEKLRGAKGDPPPVPKTLETERNLITFLLNSLGRFRMPVGASLLQELALEQQGADPEVIFHRRAQAVFALGNLGNNVKLFDKLSEKQRDRILADLKTGAESGGERGKWSADSLAYLEATLAGNKPTTLRVGDTLVEVARVKDSAAALRELVAYSLSFWDSDRADATLVWLLTDDTFKDNPVTYEPEQVAYRAANPKETRLHNQKNIAYNAAASLARRGSKEAAQAMPVFEEMLDEDRQEAIWKTENPEQQGSAGAMAVNTILAALNALDRLHKARPEMALPADAINKLAQNKNKGIRAAAQELAAKLK